MTERRVARVLVDSPLPQLDRLLDYRIPPELAERAVPGVRVRVPLRHRSSLGYLVEVAEGGDFSGELSDLDEVVSDARVLVPEVWALARRVADRAAGGAGDVLRLAVPPRSVRVEKAWLAGRRLDAPDLTAPPPIAVSGYPPGLLEAAVDGGERLALRAVPTSVRLNGDGGGDVTVSHHALTLARLAGHALRAGRSTILAVPDHRDEDDLLAALGTVLPAEAVVRVDARQPNPERYAGFLRLTEERPAVVVGNRSAIYAPAFRLGLIALWDDADPLQLEPLAPYVATRDAALIRQEQSGAALVFAGFARSAEVQRLVELGWLRDVAPAPEITPRVILTAQQDTAPARIPSTAWSAAREALALGPVLVQVARPGYAPAVACQDCRRPARCTRCAGPLRVATRGAVPDCAWCGALAADWRCPHCEGRRLRLVSRGTGRTAEELGRAFPGARILVSDGERPLTRVGPEPALVVATRGAEPVADDGYRAVLLLDGEGMLSRESLAAASDCVRWWSNAAALAAPRAPVVLVGVSGPAATALATWRQSEFAAAELADRRALRFPPALRVASITGAADAVEKAVEAARAAPILDVIGPAPVEDGALRALVRFDYAHGAAVAEALRAAVVANATSRRRPLPGKGAPRPAPTLRVRFDDPEI